MHQPHTKDFFQETNVQYTKHLPEQVRRALQKSPQLCGYEVCCEQSGDTVVLSGRVPSYYLKQVAQTVAGTVDGVCRVVNHMHVF